MRQPPTTSSQTHSSSPGTLGQSSVGQTNLIMLHGLNDRLLLGNRWIEYFSNPFHGPLNMNVAYTNKYYYYYSQNIIDLLQKTLKQLLFSNIRICGSHLESIYKLKPTVHYTTFVGPRANGRLNTRNRIVYAYRQQTLAVGATVLNVSRPDSKNESGRLVLR